MNCIDAVEGTAKSMLEKFMELAAENRLDASEYIRSVKTVIDATVLFVNNNPEVSETPDLLHRVLHDYARSLWLARLEKSTESDQAAGSGPDIDYQAYCYDYVYAHGNYPR